MSAASIRGLSGPFLDALESQVGSSGWWRDVLLRPDLFIAVRQEYMNVYHRGASVFLIELKGSRMVPSTHVKYLVRQQQKYVSLGVDGAFAVKPADVFWQGYKGRETLDEMIRSAAAFAGPEKTGLHPLVIASPNVIDVEVSLGRQGAPVDIAGPMPDSGDDLAEGDAPAEPAKLSKERARQDRLDVAVLEGRAENDVQVAFYEAKHFANKELRARHDCEPPVLEQMEGYERTIAHHSNDLAESYLEVCRALVRIDDLRQKVRQEEGVTASGSSLHPMVRHVTQSGNPPQIDSKPRLIVFGFDAAQRDDPVWKEHRKRLEGRFRIELIGDTRGRTAPAFRGRDATF